MAMIFARAPLRISLGGGGTDLPSYYRERGGFLIAGAIDKYVYIMLHDVFQRTFRLKYSEIEEVDRVSDIRHPILRETLLRHWQGPPLEIASIADIPAGTGLGSSGAYTVCLIKALAMAAGRATTPSWLAESACHIEIDVLGEPIGKQDQYAAAHGGICGYTFNEDGSVDVESLQVSTDVLERLNEQMLLFYTGETRSASTILRDQDVKTAAGDDAMLAKLDEVKRIGYASRDLLLDGRLDDFAEQMHGHWMSKRERSPGMTSPKIDSLYEVARANGAIGGKLVGAGGGGFLLTYSSDPTRTRTAMELAGAPEVRFRLDIHGCSGESR
jgi:D-glycero-alpha-D-manno-heptose-7-phosphate kinase